VGVISLTGTLLAGPPGAGCGGLSTSLSSLSVSDFLRFFQNPKPYAAATSVLEQTIASPSAFVSLVTIGASGPVQQADTLILFSDGAIEVERTHDDGTGTGTTVETNPLQGLYIAEFPQTRRLKGLRVKGTSRIVYFASGPY